MSYDSGISGGRIIAALDLGSSKTVAIVARVQSAEEVEVIGLGVVESRGVKSGSVTNIELTVKAIRDAIEEAELMSALDIDEVIINISGKNVHGANHSGMVTITGRDRIITHADVFRVIDTAQNVRIPADQEVLHVLSREFKVDDQAGIKDPLGMVGVRLDAQVHIVTAPISQLQNTEKAVEQAGVRVSNKVLSALASSQALITEAEKDLGVAICDIGSGVIDLIIYVDGGVEYSATICLGGQHVTQDLSIGLKTPIDAAEMLKKRRGTARAADVDPMEMVDVPSVGERPARQIPRRDLALIIEARMREMLELVDIEIMKSGRKNILAGGIIFTGGGAQLEGLVGLAEEVLQLGASVAYPKGLLGISDKVASPPYSTATGLLLYQARYGETETQKGTRNLFGKMKNWLQKNL
ncbi:cell division protein FtsA [Turneriella parva]|uniref:Cell division protein FtsA n=1 Tax=Turneriella parva (strain ATCC BAA-1111 / DSM 21527 / NCTC 11395 / H) TaxID=869212 RepID=I4B814_TURPD|nr:cell division protein FtsA [Turneriella parva]AFM13421.1 cell division protein FtsA [Turneriella parva DSM 21527]